ncbi:TPA: MFS transporter [Listeria monocytogenes]|uniref:MFS transporter n=1 Tax=Listeria monocytogenes TaxID=1639 RepID=UPI00077A7E30|nr:MFS transporter [Listeria monocytogenes]EAF4459829.1 MFS transporter [Listeria monocytogenes]EAF4477319.1 MFS transporter [Listeria monocytogenes]EEP7676030.1 MFS transporter [Listeria monocytogenes]EEP7713570.1 MFS transporter [Listeria monocytogenes]EGC8317284.1 MFS transporter [Listeria monocytogenes]
MGAKGKFWILTMVVAISGLSQGVLLPLIAIILEERGISAGINGFHATGIYLGVLLISPFIEAPLHKYGYKPIILVGGGLVAVSILAFPIWFNLYFWFILRLLIGVGDHMLHFSSQTWIGAMSDPSKRGRNMAIYGLFFSLGFAIGPQLVNLAEINANLPFFLSGILVLIAWGLVWFVRNDFVGEKAVIRKISFWGSLKRFSDVFKLAWVAMISPFLYGILETGLNATFPVVGLRDGLDTMMIAMVISSFSVGTIIFQVPIGIVSDKFGRGKVLPLLTGAGAVVFVLTAFVKIPVLYVVFFFVLGILLGSLYSLGLSYMTDLTPLELLPAGNILVGMCFSLGSIIGPSATGMMIGIFGNQIFYFVVAGILVLGCLLLIFGARKDALEKKMKN